MRREFIRPLDNRNFASWRWRDFRSIEAEKLTAPPVSRAEFLCHGSEPRLPQYSADVERRRLNERIALEEGKNVGIVGEQAFLGERHDFILVPITERGEPEVPFKSWLIGRVDARGLIQGLRLVAERIGDPVLTVAGALKFDFVTAAGHHGEKAVLICDAKGIEGSDGRGRKRNVAKRNANQFRGRVVGDPCKHDRGYGETDGVEMTGESAADGATRRRGIAGFVVARRNTNSGSVFTRIDILQYLRLIRAKTRWNEAKQKHVVEQQETDRQDKVVEERVVG